MWIHSGFPKTFWADVINTATFLINRGPSVPVGFRIPEEAWNGKKVNISYLKVFGCLSYVHIDDATRNKLDPKSKKCYFIGYGDTELGYRFWDAHARKRVQSRNVVFNEQTTYGDELNGSSTKKAPEGENSMVDLKDFSTTELEEEDTSMTEVRSARADGGRKIKETTYSKGLSNVATHVQRKSSDTI